MSDSNRIKIYVEQQGGEEAYALMQKLEASINRLNRNKKFKTLGGLQGAKAELQSYINELDRLEKIRKQKLESGLSTKSVDLAIRKQKDAVRELGNEMDRANAKSVSLGQAMRTTFNSVQSSVIHVGRQLDSMGRTLTKISTPLRMLFRGTVLSAGYKALNLFTEGLNNTFGRADIMNTYDKSLTALGLDAKEKFSIAGKEAKTAKQNLDEAVQGLPTGLDEIMAKQKKYAGATGEMVSSTKTAIAANNAVIASQMGSREQLFMEKYLVAMSSGAELAKTQWESMFRIAPLVMRSVGAELGYAGDKYEEFREQVLSGTLAGKDFLAAFQKVGIEGAVADAARVVVTTWSGLASNIRIATTRMGQGIIDTLNETFKDATGRTLLEQLLGRDSSGKEMGDGIRDWINSLSASIQGWIRANPEYFLEFFNILKSIDWNGFVRGIGKGVLETLDNIKQLALYLTGAESNRWIDGLKKFFGLFGMDSMEDFGKFMARAPLFGTFLTTLGGFLKGSAGIIAGLVTVLSIGRLTRGAEGGLFGLFGKLIGSPRSIGQMAKSLKSLPSIGTMFKGFVSGIMSSLTMFANVALIGGTAIVALGSMQLILRQIKDLVEIFDDFKPADFDMMQNIIAKTITFFGVMGGLAWAIGNFGMYGGIMTIYGAGILAAITAIIGLITAIVSGFMALDAWLVKKALQNFKEAVDYLKDGLTTLNEVKGMDVDLESIKDVMSKYSEAISLLNPRITTAFGERDVTNFEAKNLKKIMENLADAIGSLKKIKETIDEANGFRGFIGSSTDNIKEIFRDLGEIYESIQKSFNTVNGLSEKSTGEISAMLDNTKKTFDLLIGEGGIVEQMNKLNDVLPSVISDNRGRSADNTMKIDATIKQLETFFNGIGEMYRFIATKTPNLQQDKYAKKVSETITATQDVFSKIVGEGGIITQIQNMQKQLAKITVGKMYGEASPIDRVTEYLKVFFSKISKIYSPEIWSASDLQQAENNDGKYKAILENLQGAFNFLLGDNGIIAQISAMSKEFKSLFTADIYGAPSAMTQFNEHLKALFSSISDIYTYFSDETTLDDGNLDSFKTDMESLKGAVENIKEAVTQIGSINELLPSLTNKQGEFEIGAKVQELISSLTGAFDTEAISSLTAQISSFKESISTALQSITELGEEIVIEASVKLGDGFQKSVDDVVKVIGDAAKSINDAWDLIPNSLSKEIPITITYNTDNVQRFPNLGVPTRLNTGGYVGGMGKVLYRSKGGDIYGSIFKPKGKDIVPSMLAVGEYVQQKKAVDFWGIDFMRKVNHMDIRGVMSELTSKVMGNASRNTVVNNYYNNNQKVVQNINTNSPDFAFKSASRFAGAF